ncbi:Ion transport domain - like 3 [Theobroma cacao]|nr:Ion transport domain - like 3 [Theobroma cacao]
MDKPLLFGESSNGGGRRDPLYRRSEAITYGSPYQKAAALVDLAEDGVGLPEQILDKSSFGSAAKFYFIFIKFDLIWTLNYFALIVLNFFEKPLWCLRSSSYSCSDREYFFLGQLPYLTSTESLIYEVVTLLLFMIHTFFPIFYEGSHIYWKRPLNQLKVICLLILVTDLLVYALYLSPVTLTSLPLRVAPYVRVIIFILNIRELRTSILILAGMIKTYLNVLALWLLFLLFASWVAYVMFEDTQEGKLVFTSYGTTLYQMFVLFTTSNNPDVWIPAYKASRWYCLFFVLYVLVGVYFVTNLILAVVYDSFKSELAKQVSEMDRTRRSILCKAFGLIDDYKVGFLNKEQCIRLFEELNKYRTLPKISREEFELIFDELDDSHDFKLIAWVYELRVLMVVSVGIFCSYVRVCGTEAVQDDKLDVGGKGANRIVLLIWINLDEFTDLCNAIGLRFQKEDSPSLFERFPIYRSPFSENLKAFVQSPKFGYIVSIILILNLFAVIIETTLDIENNSGQKVWQEVEFVFGWMYVLEMALKVYAFGFENYWRDGQNRFDFLITWIIVIGETITFATPDGLDFFSNGEWIRYLLLARMLRLIRLLMHVRSYRAFVATFLTLIPSLMPYLGTIFCVLCIYCSLGIQIFGGIVNAGNSNLDGTDLSDDEYPFYHIYLLFNFNDYPNGMVTLFNLLVMGNWQVWMQSYKELTGTSWTLVYFISFYLITVLLLLNLVVAFVLEAFFTEMDLETSGNCEEDDKDAGSGKYRRRLVGTKTRSQRIDILLHHMLSAELDKGQSSASSTP